jgi:DNA-binding GntR family transcriptional regulator
LRQQIIRLELAPGAAISENDLASQLGVSRTPVREALLLLQEEGLVEVYPRIGSVVSRVNPKRIAEAQFLREAVEVASLRSLAEPSPADGPVPDRDQLAAALGENLDEQLGADTARFFELDEQFHKGLMQLAGHGGSWTSVAQAKAHLDRARLLIIRDVSDNSQLVKEHRTILESTLDGDITAATSALTAHLRQIFTDIKTVQESAPELFATTGATPVRKTVIVWE